MKKKGMEISGGQTHMGVSKNSGFSPQIIHFNRVFHYKPSILGYPYFWRNYPYQYMTAQVSPGYFSL